MNITITLDSDHHLDAQDPTRAHFRARCDEHDIAVEVSVTHLELRKRPTAAHDLATSLMKWQIERTPKKRGES